MMSLPFRVKSPWTQSRYIYRVITSVPTFFVRMLGKLLDACIPIGWRLALTARGTCRARAVDHVPTEKKWVHENVSIKQR